MNGKLGLVFSGGGARGAYQVGVVKALAQLGLEPVVISGTSIGALNGAIVAASKTMREAAQLMESIWLQLNTEKVLKINWISVCYAAITLLDLKLKIFRDGTLKGLEKEVLRKISPNKDVQHFALFDEKPLEDILSQVLDIKFLLSSESRAYYVSVFPATETLEVTLFDNIMKDLWRYFKSNEKSVFMKVKDYSYEEVLQLIIASASIPLAFRPIQIGKHLYRDGGLGDRLRVQGNTAVEPLLWEGCTHAIITIIGDGVLWSRYEWRELSIFEIRPSKPLYIGGEIKSVFDFNPTRIRELIKQGEEDTLSQFEKFEKNLKIAFDYNKAHAHLQELFQSENGENIETSPIERLRKTIVYRKF